MNKFSKTFVVFALVLCFVLTAALFVACNDDKDDAQPETITYTVTVTCEDASALANVKVQLNKADGTSAAEAKALDANGKATFDLAPANYTATLTGVPADYQFANGSLTSETKECTIAVTKNTPAPTTYAYSVTVTYPAVNDVYGNQVTAAGPAAGVKVSLYDDKLSDDRGSALDGKTPAATATTGADGKATFSLTGELYTIVLSDYTAGLHIAYPQGESVWTVAKTAKDAAISFTSSAALGSSSSAPLALQLGANEIPLTNDALTLTGGMGVCYSFTPAETGNYTFTSTGNAVVLASDGINPILQGEASTVLALTAGEPYICYCIANGVASTYTLTIAKGGELAPSGGDEYPWTEGEGTIADPFTTTTLAGTYELHIKASSPIYLAYTPTANETYTFSTTCNDLWLEIYDDVENIEAGNDFLLRLSDTTTSGEITLTAATKYYILIGTWNDDENDINFTVQTINTYTVTLTYPDLHDVFGNVANAAGPATGVTVALYAGELEGDGTRYLEGLTAAATATTGADGKATFQLTGETYTIVVSNLKAGYALNYRSSTGFVSVYTVTKAAPDCTLPIKESTLVGSSDKLPLTIGTGETQIAENDTNDLYYAFTPATSGNYTFEMSADATLIATDLMIQGEGKFVRALQADTTYILNVFSFSACTLKITAGGEMKDNYPWTAGEGTVEAPYQETELKEAYRSLYVPENAPFYFAYTPSEDETYDFGTYSNTLLEIYNSKDAATAGQAPALKLDADTKTGSLTLTANTTYYFKVGTLNNKAGQASFDATKQAAAEKQPAPEDLTEYQPTGGDGEIGTPYTITNLQAKYTFTVASEDSAPYLAYTPSQNETYIIATEDDNLWLTIYIKQDPTEENDYEDKVVVTKINNDQMYYELEMTGGTTYLFLVDAYTYNQPCTFMAYAKAGSESEEEAPTYDFDGNGLFDDPYILETVEGTYTFHITEGNLVYLSFTCNEDATYTITADNANLYLSIYTMQEPEDDSDTGRRDLGYVEAESSPYELQMTSGTTYYFEVDIYEPYDVNTTFTITKKA